MVSLQRPALSSQQSARFRHRHPAKKGFGLAAETRFAF